jgi:hypothetical protein
MASIECDLLGSQCCSRDPGEAAETMNESGTVKMREGILNRYCVSNLQLDLVNCPGRLLAGIAEQVVDRVLDSIDPIGQARGRAIWSSLRLSAHLVSGTASRGFQAAVI